MRHSSLLVLLLAACSSMPTLTPDSQAPSAPTRQRAQLQNDGSVLLTWKNPDDGDLAGVLVARFIPGGTARKPEGTPVVGDPIGTDGRVLFSGKEESFVDRTPPATCGVVSYRLWAQDTQGRWSEGLALIELPPGQTSPAPTEDVTQLSAARSGTALTVQWTNPAASTGFFQSTLVRRLGAAPVMLSDGSLLQTGTATSFTESAQSFAPGTQVFYGVAACNACGRCRAPVVVSVTLSATDGGLPVDAGTPGDAGPGDAGQVDAGAPTDAGADAGATGDAGAPVDAGSTDAGEPDAGSTALDGGAMVTDGGLRPSAFTVALSPDGQRVVFSWMNGASPQLSRVRVTRVLTEGATAGAPVTVFEGNASTASERTDALLPSTAMAARQYTYEAVGCSAAGCEASGPTQAFTLTLKQALRGGGYTLFWRHASADVCGDRTNLCPSSLPPGQTCAQALAGTANDNWWKTCVADPPTCSTTARQLNTVAAPNETNAVRTWFTSNGVTVGRILTSEYCRCFQTAQQFMFPPTLEYSQDLTYWVYEESLRCPKTMALLNQAPAAGTVTGLVSHAGFFCPTVDSLAWGEAAIYKPQAPTTRTCTTVGTCNADEACVSGLCVKPLLIGRVPALGGGSWSTLP